MWCGGVSCVGVDSVADGALVRSGHLGLQQQRDLAGQHLRVALGLQPALGPRTCRRKDHGCKSVCLISESAIINEVLVLETGKIKEILYIPSIIFRLGFF